MPEAPGASAPELGALEAGVLELVRELARELHGERAARAVGLQASLEREVGLGSLELVELQLRVERRFGRSLPASVQTVDTPAELARLLLGATEAGARAELLPAVLADASELEPAETIHGTLWRRALAHPERPHAYLREDDGREHTLTYGALLQEARAVAGGLRERGVARGQTVALMLPTGLDFLRSFQGILVAGAIPVPIYPPARLDRLEEYALRQAAILRDAGVRLMITLGRARPVAALLRPAVPTLSDVVTAGELVALEALWQQPEGGPTDAAFVQYTSGSTGQPKGVLLTHANLMANIKAIGAGLAARPDDVAVSWLPLYHDMGLIGSWLFSLVRGYPIDIQSPLSFLARPERWLWAIHRRRGTLSAAPNFAYELCARRVPEEALEGLDLSSWRCALNGAEPVQPETLERFAARYARYGFRREALLPVYGLAENSVALAFPPVGRGPRYDRVRRAAFEGEGRAEPAPSEEASALRFVSVGRALPEHELRLLDDQGQDVPERTLGRLVFRGPSTTTGYFGKPAATAAITLPGGFLDSGDLAYAADGEIYITGRRKDLIIKGGRKLVPQELEELCAQVPGVRRGCVAAFGVAREAQGTEALVVVAETRLTASAARARVEAHIIEALVQQVGLPPDEVVLAPPGAVPKTSSGKIRRADTRALYLAGKLGQRRGSRLGGALRLWLAAIRERATVALRRAGRAAYALRLLLTLVPVALGFWLLALVCPGRRASLALARWGSRAGLRLLGCSLQASGLEHLRTSQPLLLAANHTSYLDIPLLLALLPHDFAFVSKVEAARWPLVGLLIRRGGHLTVDRSDSQDSLATAERVKATLRAGRSVLVFPEATFVAAAGLRPFRLGVFKTATELGLTLVPIAIQGARQALRDKTWLPRPGALQLRVLAPLAPGANEWSAVLALREQAAAAIAAECGEPRMDLVASGPIPEQRSA